MQLILKPIKLNIQQQIVVALLQQNLMKKKFEVCFSKFFYLKKKNI
jgi:hypothetical protein